MSNVVIKENHLICGGKAYFRGGADDVILDVIGEKRTPLFKQNYLEVKDRLPAVDLTGVRSTAVEIDASTLSKTDFPLTVSVIVPVGGIPVPTKFDGEVICTKLRSYDLKLVKFSILPHDLVKVVNQSPQKRQSLIGWGQDARIVYQVFLVMAAEVVTTFDHDITVSLSTGVDDVEQATAGAGGSTSGSLTVKFDPGVCFAYLLAKPEWDAHRMIDVNDDQWSFN